MSRFKNVGLCINPRKPHARRIHRQLSSWLARRGLKVRSDATYSRAKLIGWSDLVIALGGDGTLLNIIRYMTPKHNPPILGVNLGGLGFLTEISVQELFPTLTAVMNGKFRVSERTLLRVSVSPGAKKYFALNDVVINRGTFARILKLGVRVGGERVALYRSDGVIIATATGSTAHSLSGGGPIVHPGMEAVIINPICPHTLSNRPIVLSAQKRIEVRIEGEAPSVGLTVDGQQGQKLTKKARVKVDRAPFKVRLISSPKRSYWQLLHEKLNLNVRNRQAR